MSPPRVTYGGPLMTSIIVGHLWIETSKKVDHRAPAGAAGFGSTHQRCPRKLKSIADGKRITVIYGDEDPGEMPPGRPSPKTTPKDFWYMNPPGG
jgi:hypothetical protein